MSAERDELLLGLHGPLLADIREQDDYAVSAVTSISAYSEGVEHALDTVWAKGYRKPRTVTAPEELDALPVGSVLLDIDGDVCQRFRGGWRATINEPNDDPWLSDRLEVHLPATVLHEGATK